MVIRQQQIRQIATIIREHEDALLAYGGDLTYAQVEATNRDGYTLEFAAPLGGTLRQEGVILGDDEIRRAWDLAHAPAGS